MIPEQRGRQQQILSLLHLLWLLLGQPKYSDGMKQAQQKCVTTTQNNLKVLKKKCTCVYLLHYNCNIKYNYIFVSNKDTCNKILWFYNPIQHSSLVTVKHHRTGKGLGWWISSLLILLTNSKITLYFIFHRGINFWNNVAGSQKVPAAP